MNDAFDAQAKKLLVCEKRCDQCLFSKAKIVDDQRRAQLLADCKKSGRYFLCHKSTIKKRAVVCRGFFDEVPNRACQVAKRLDLVAFVDPEG